MACFGMDGGCDDFNNKMASPLKPQLPLPLPPSLPNKSRLKTLPTLATPQGTFISKADRFIYQYQDSPGPGSYDSPPPQAHTHRITDDSPHLVIPKQHQWIISKGRQPFQLRQASEHSQEDQDGSSSEKKSMGRSNWSKNVRFDYTKLEKKSNVGPGKYNPERSAFPGERAHTLPMQRASPAAYLKDILEQSRRRVKDVPDLEEQLLKLKMETIQVQRQAKNNKKKEAPSANFKSNSKRLYSQRQLTDIGPGAYDILSSPGTNPNNNHPKKTIILKKSPTKPPIPIHQRTKSSSLLADMATRQDNPPPGPGAYQLQANSLKKSALGTILKQQRFISRSTQGPGPGQYMRKRFVHVNPNELQQKANGNPFTKLPQVRPTFGTTERFGAWQTKEVPFGQYELTYEDISQRALRLREPGSKSRVMRGKVSQQGH